MLEGTMLFEYKAMTHPACRRSQIFRSWSETCKREEQVQAQVLAFEEEEGEGSADPQWLLDIAAGPAALPCTSLVAASLPLRTTVLVPASPRFFPIS